MRAQLGGVRCDAGAFLEHRWRRAETDDDSRDRAVKFERQMIVERHGCAGVLANVKPFFE